MQTVWSSSNLTHWPIVGIPPISILPTDEVAILAGLRAVIIPFETGLYDRDIDSADPPWPADGQH